MLNSIVNYFVDIASNKKLYKNAEYTQPVSFIETLKNYSHLHVLYINEVETGSFHMYINFSLAFNGTYYIEGISDFHLQANDTLDINIHQNSETSINIISGSYITNDDDEKDQFRGNNLDFMTASGKDQLQTDFLFGIASEDIIAGFQTNRVH
jgi:hypothetical protein